MQTPLMKIYQISKRFDLKELNDNDLIFRIQEQIKGDSKCIFHFASFVYQVSGWIFKQYIIDSLDVFNIEKVENFKRFFSTNV